MNDKNLNDVIEPELKFQLDEKKSSEVDGVNILGKVRGQFFVPDGASRNNRWYPKSLWEKVIENKDVQRRLKKRLMFGTVGHDEELGDKAIREGKVSHVITKIEIDSKGRGIGEALILNTPVGHNLNTVLRAGAELYVSSRADGTYDGEHKGMPVVNEDTYLLEGWDFVVDPGFLEAHPTIAESLINSHNKNEDTKTGSTKEISMNEELIKHITNENAELKNTVKNFTDEVKALKEDRIAVDEENAHLKEENAKLEEANKKVADFEKFAKHEELEEALKKLEEDKKLLAEFLELADNAGETKKCLEDLRDALVTYKEIGTADQIKEALEKSDKFVEEVSKLGKLEEIKTSLEAFNKQLTEEDEAKKEKENKELAEELGLKEEKVVELRKKFEIADIKEMFGAFKGETEPTNEDKDDDDSDKYKKTNEDKEDKEDKDLDEDAPVRKSRIERLNERLGK